MARPQRTHYLRGNAAERSPHRLFCWDTETDQESGPRSERHTLNCWSAVLVERHQAQGRPARETLSHGPDVGPLLDAIEEAAHPRQALWAFAHNQTFDLVVTRLPYLLARRGWQLGDHALHSDSPWARLSKDGRRLVLADSTSWLPGKLEDIAQAIGMTKAPLPDSDSPADHWYARCDRDALILARAMTALMDWWDAERLGSWSITGPQSGFNAMRHKPQAHKVVIEPSPEARTFERRAISGGRREVWETGQLRSGDYRELDFYLAHATIAAHCALPKWRSARFERMALDDWRVTSDRWGVIAECLVRAERPRYPLQLGGRLFYPMGTFRTVLCGPEVREAHRRGELLQVGPGHLYQLGAHMADWGHWVLDTLKDAIPGQLTIQQQAVKQWARVVPGKWAARTGRTIQQGPTFGRGWGIEEGVHHPSGAHCAVFDLEGTRRLILQDQDADDAFPAVLAWVQSEVRARLGRLIDLVGDDRMVSCNTDGVLCRAWRDMANDLGELDVFPLRVREKARYRHLEVLSPQHIIHDGERRLSGVPAGAKEVAPHEYTWMTWPRMRREIELGGAAGYVRERRSADLSNVPVNRWVTESGRCLPVYALHLPGEAPMLLPGPVREGAGPIPRLRPAQHPVLLGL